MDEWKMRRHFNTHAHRYRICACFDEDRYMSIDAARKVIDEYKSGKLLSFDVEE